MTPEMLLALVLDYTNTNDYDDEADGWLSTRLEGSLLTVEFMQDSDEGQQVWFASWEMRQVPGTGTGTGTADGQAHP